VLRAVVAALGVVLIVAGVALGVFVHPYFFQFTLGGLIILGGTLFEARRYRARVSRTTGWQDTPEKFVDPTTGKLMRVRFNPQTGERDYVEEQPPSG
jgi:hypothetical protein